MASPARPIHHVAVVVCDLDRAERFYSDVLGLSVLRRWEDAAGRPRSVWLALGGGAFLAIERAEDPSGRTRADLAPGLHCLALAIRPDERDGMRDKLSLAGFPVIRESPYTLYTRDPDGNLIGLSHFPDEAS
jgi:glyoxylase I family protein